MPAPSGETNARCWRILSDAAEGVGAQYIESGVWSKHLFADPIHLNADGSRYFSGMLASVLVGNDA